MAQRPQPTFIPDSDIETSSQPESTEDTVVLQDTYEGDPRLSVLEAQVLGEWARLRGNLDTLSAHLQSLSSTPSALIADELRLLERKTNLVCTALKSSVYSIVLSAQDEEGGQG